MAEINLSAPDKTAEDEADRLARIAKNKQAQNREDGGNVVSGLAFVGGTIASGGDPAGGVAAANAARNVSDAGFDVAEGKYGSAMKRAGSMFPSPFEDEDDDKKKKLKLPGK